jgi:hypothetical protein
VVIHKLFERRVMGEQALLTPNLVCFPRRRLTRDGRQRLFLYVRSSELGTEHSVER